MQRESITLTPNNMKKGLTPIELLAVVAIIGILVSVVLSRVMRDESKLETCDDICQNIAH